MMDITDRGIVNITVIGGIPVTRTPCFGQLGYEENGVRCPYPSYGQLAYEKDDVRYPYPNFGQIGYEDDDIRYPYPSRAVKLIIAPDVCVHMHRETVTIVEEETRKVIL